MIFKRSKWNICSLSSGLAFKSLVSGSTNLQVYQAKGFKLTNKFNIEHDDEDIYEEGREIE